MKDFKIIAALCVCCVLFLSCRASRELKKNVYVDRFYAKTTNLDVFQVGQKLPDNLFRIGSVTVGEAGFTRTEDCTYEACLSAIKKEAQNAGADVVYIVSILEPGGWSTCYSVTAELYKYAND